LLTLGINGILSNCSAPGHVAGQGVICLLLAFYALGVLDVNYTGLLFIVPLSYLWSTSRRQPRHTDRGAVSVLGSILLTSHYQVSFGSQRRPGDGAFFAFIIANRHPAPAGDRAEALVGTSPLPGPICRRWAPSSSKESGGGRGDRRSGRAGERVRIKSVDGFLARDANLERQPIR
jgi:hypothetical protein